MKVTTPEQLSVQNTELNYVVDNLGIKIKRLRDVHDGLLAASKAAAVVLFNCRSHADDTEWDFKIFDDALEALEAAIEKAEAMP